MGHLDKLREMEIGDEVKFTLKDFIENNVNVVAIVNGSHIPKEIDTVVAKKSDGIYLTITRLNDVRCSPIHFAGNAGDEFSMSIESKNSGEKVDYGIVRFEGRVKHKRDGIQYEKLMFKKEN